MASIEKKDNSQRKPKPQNKKKQQVQTPAAPLKWKIGKECPIVPSGHGDLEGAVQITICSAGFTTGLLIHHPIGVTPLDKNDLVLTPVETVPSLLARKIDKKAKALEEAGRAYRDEELVKAGILLADDEKGICYQNGLSRSKCRAEARIALAEANPKVSKKKLQEMDFTPYLSAEATEAEKQCQRYCAENGIDDEIARKYTSKYETLGGPYTNIRQEAIQDPTFSGVEDDADLADLVVKWIRERMYATPVASPNVNDDGAADEG